MKRRKTNNGQDVVVEGVWLTAETLRSLLHGQQLNREHGGNPMTDTMWKCDQLRAGQLYSRMLFDTQAEARQFARRMQEAEPDQVFAIEAVEASQVWN